jgi:long-chain acyl-CoA synthetase
MYLADIVEAVEVIGPRFVQIYGQGESPMCITALSRRDISDRETRGWERRLESVGYAQSCVEVRVADEDGVDLPTGQIGEILVKGPSVMQGYWNAPEATAATLSDGWLKTGDMGLLGPDGALTLKDRSKDVIITGGSNVYPREVEEALLLHPGVLEVAVIGRSDPEWGESVVAFVVTHDKAGIDASELDAHCNARIARFKRPKAYVFVPELPKNNYGKVLKTELRKMVA